MDRRLHNWSTGFTLVETIFSTLFISLTVLAIINLFPGAYLSVKRSETALQSEYLANSILEEIRMTPFADLSPGVYSTTSEPFQTVTIDGIAYSPRVTVYDVPGCDSRIVKGVKVEVNYRVHTTSRMTVFETYIHSLIR